MINLNCFTVANGKKNNIHYINNKSLYAVPKCSYKDTISFGSQSKLFSKYGINPDKTKVEAPQNVNIDNDTKKLLIEKILEAHEMGLKNKNSGNVTKSGYATNICLSDGSWHLATNFNNTRNDISSVCGERSAVLVAYNKKLKEASLDSDEDKLKYAQNFKVKYIAMSSFKPIGEDLNASSPCVDCLSWLNTERFFDNDTLIAALEKNNETNEIELVLKTISQLLPLRNEIDSINNTGLAVKSLPVEFSENASKTAKEKNISETVVKELLQRAYDEFDSNTLVSFSEQNAASSILAAGEIFSAKKIDWSKRWFMEPAEFAAAKAVEKLGKDCNIDAIAYYGEGNIKDKYGTLHKDGLVSLKTLGRIKTGHGNKDTIVVTIQNDTILVRTIEDYMPEKYGFVQQYVTIS